MKISGILSLLFLFLCSCGIQDGEPDGIFIRVQNNSDVNFTGVIVQSGNVEQAFGEIPARTSSEYEEFEYAFRYGAVWLEAEGRDFSLIPIDYVGEIPLRDGFYTYRIGLSSANLTDATLVFELVED
ncbi:hypothetical protein [Algoriphagus sp. A40]|uniref:hypothetical protein n=1 Tax=Algoriphagus sp. A40 TaxID=1945863 RepID=UPI000986FB05|nr:hypothetical protein [Algoriphagus sp. A40]OOG71120.1 hypothetical protein B0E43_17530 [Algoriphagus sp. A40]